MKLDIEGTIYLAAIITLIVGLSTYYYFNRER